MKTRTQILLLEQALQHYSSRRDKLVPLGGNNLVDRQELVRSIIERIAELEREANS